MKNNIYIVVAHPGIISTLTKSYIVDVLGSKDNAIKIADKEFKIRGTKIFCEVQEWKIDKIRSKNFLDENINNPSINNKVVYTTGIN